jgi:hypothetical protein
MPYLCGSWERFPRLPSRKENRREGNSRHQGTTFPSEPPILHLQGAYCEKVLHGYKNKCRGWHRQEDTRAECDGGWTRVDERRTNVVFRRVSFAAALSLGTELGVRGQGSYFRWGKVETPIHGSIRELVTWECKEDGVKIMNVLANPKRKCWALESEFKEAWAIFHKFFEARLL